MNQVLSCTVAVVVVDRNNRPVDGELLKVGAPVTVELRVEVGEDAALEQRILSKINTSHDVARLKL